MAIRTESSPFISQVPERNSRVIDILLVLSIPAIGILDGVTGGQIRLTAFFIIPIMLITWRFDARFGYIAAAISFAILTLINARAPAALASPTAFVLDAAGRLISFFVIVAILARLHRAYLQQRVLATRDALTGLYNRLGMLEIIAVEMEQARRREQAFTALFLDCDNFKAVNDRWGHQTGDRLLQIVAVTLKKSIRRSDLACRLGGDEFVVFFADMDEAESGAFIGKLKHQLDAEMRRHRWPVTFSIGAVVFHSPPDDAACVIDAADELMYKAKSSGKNKVNIVTYGEHAECPPNAEHSRQSE